MIKVYDRYAFFDDNDFKASLDFIKSKNSSLGFLDLINKLDKAEIIQYANYESTLDFIQDHLSKALSILEINNILYNKIIINPVDFISIFEILNMDKIFNYFNEGNRIMLDYNDNSISNILSIINSMPIVDICIFDDGLNEKLKSELDYYTDSDGNTVIRIFPVKNVFYIKKFIDILFQYL